MAPPPPQKKRYTQLQGIKLCTNDRSSMEIYDPFKIIIFDTKFMNKIITIINYAPMLIYYNIYLETPPPSKKIIKYDIRTCIIVRCVP